MPRWGRRIWFEHGRPARYEQGEQPTDIGIGSATTLEYLDQWPENSAPANISYDQSPFESNTMVSLRLSLVGGLDDDERGSGAWSIVDDPTSQFSLSAATGPEVDLLAEAQPVGTYQVDVRYSGDHGGPPLLKTVLVNVVRTDDPPVGIEFTPSIGAASTTTPVGTKIFDVSLAGGSPTGAGTWAITNDPTGVLEITPTTGTIPIIVTNGLFTAAQVAPIEVTYSGEQGSGVLTASVDLNIDATLDPPTALVAVPAAATIQETLQPGSLIATLSLFGGSPTGSGTWSITTDPTAAMNLVPQTGNTTAQLFLSTTPPVGAYTIEIAYSGEQGSGVLTLDYPITVQDATSQQPPTGIAATIQNIAVSETAANGSVVSVLTLTGGQPDGSGTWSLTDNAGGQLSVSGTGTSVNLLTSGALTVGAAIPWVARYSGEQGGGALTYTGSLQVISASQQSGVIWQTNPARTITTSAGATAPVMTRATPGQGATDTGALLNFGANQFRWAYSAGLGTTGIVIESTREFAGTYRRTLSSWALSGTATDSGSDVTSLSGDTCDLIDIGANGTISQTFAVTSKTGIIEFKIYASIATRIALVDPSWTQANANADSRYWIYRDLLSGWNTITIHDISRLYLDGSNSPFPRNLIISTDPVTPAAGVLLAIDRTISFRGERAPLYHDASGAAVTLDADICARDITGQAIGSWYYEIGLDPIDLAEEGEDLVNGPFRERCIASLNGGDPATEIGVSHSNGVVYLYNRATAERIRVGSLNASANRVAWSPMTGACALNGQATAKISAPTVTFTEERIGSSLVHGELSGIVTVAARSNSGGPISDAALQAASALVLAPSNYVLPSAGSGNIQGTLLTANPGQWTGNPLTITYTYQWLRDGVDITGATSATYALQAADVGTRVSVRVQATNSSGSSIATSPETLPVVATGASSVVQTYSIVERSGVASTTIRKQGVTFEEGRVPRGYKIAARIAGGSQIATANIMRNYWADGSLRNCGIVADSGSLGASATRNMELIVVPDAGGIAAVNPWSWLAAWASDITIEIRNRQSRADTAATTGTALPNIDWSLKSAAANANRREIVENHPNFVSIRCWDDAEPDDRHLFVTWHVDFHISGSTVKAMSYTARIQKPRLRADGQAMQGEAYTATVKLGGATVETYPIAFHQHLCQWATLDQSAANVTHARPLWANIDGATAKPTVDIQLGDTARRQIFANGVMAPFDLTQDWVTASGNSQIVKYTQLGTVHQYQPLLPNAGHRANIDNVGGWHGRGACPGIDTVCLVTQNDLAQRNARVGATTVLHHGFHYTDHRMLDRATSLWPIPSVSSAEFVPQAYPNLGKPAPHGLQDNTSGQKWPLVFEGASYPHASFDQWIFKANYGVAFEGAHVAKLADFQAFWQAEQYLMDSLLSWAAGTIAAQPVNHNSSPRDNGLWRMGVPAISGGQHRTHGGVYPSLSALTVAPANHPMRPIFKNYLAATDEMYAARTFRDFADNASTREVGYFTSGWPSDISATSKTGYRNRRRPWYVSLFPLYSFQYLGVVERAFSVSLPGFRAAMNKTFQPFKQSTDIGRLFPNTSSNVLVQRSDDGSTHVGAGQIALLRDFEILADGLFTHGYKFEDDRTGFPSNLGDGPLPSLANGDRLIPTRENLDRAGIDPLPPGLVEGQTYYVVNASGGFFQLSATDGGAPVDIQQTSGNMTAGVYSSVDTVAVVGDNGTNDYANAGDTYAAMCLAIIELGYAYNLGLEHQPTATNVFAWRSFMAPAQKIPNWNITASEIRALPTSPEHSLAAVTASATEGGQFTFRVDRAPATGATSVDWAVTGSGGNPADATDFGGSFPSGTVSFADGENSKLIQFSSSQDATVEDDEGFTVTISNPSVGSTIGTATRTGTIQTDDFAAPTIAIAADQVSQPEGASGPTAFTFTVTRTGDPAPAISVDWAVTGSGGNPAVAADFVGGVLPSGTLNIASLATSGQITVNVQGDLTAENDEAFTVTLSNPSGATITTATASSTITDDDTSAGWQPSDYANLTHHWDYTNSANMTLSGSSISQLNDLEGTENLTQATPANRPTFDGTNNDTDCGDNSALAGSGTLATEIAAGGTNFFFVRPNTDTGSVTRYILRVGLGGGHRVVISQYNDKLFVGWNATGAATAAASNVFVSGQAVMFSVTRVGTSLKVRINDGAETLLTAADPGSVDNIGIPGRANNPTGVGFSGDYLHCITTNDEPSEADRNRFFGWMAHAEGAQALLDPAHPYRNTAP